MRVLFLGPNTSPVLRHLWSMEHDVKSTQERITDCGQDFIVSHGYRHIVPRHICEEYDGRAVNLHIGYLPWNRGADPNLWSHVDGTPKGVTIHYIDPGLDTGDLIAQRLVSFNDQDTLASSYEKLQDAMFRLFVSWWPKIKTGDCPRTSQVGKGTYHRSADKRRIHLPGGWETPISLLRPADHH